MRIPVDTRTAYDANVTTADSSSAASLARRIGRWDLVALVLNVIIGAGIFGLPSGVFALAGTYSLLAFLACAVVVILIALCFAEVGSRFSGTGGPYLYARAAFGNLAAFQMGWLLWLARITAFASLANLFVAYLSIFVPSAATPVGRDVVLIAVTVVLVGVNLLGVRPSTLFTDAFTIGKLGPLLFFVVLGLFHLDRANFTTANVPHIGAFSQAVLLLVFAFSGFEMAVIPSGETVEPERNIPFALLTGIGFVIVLYLAIQTVSIGTLPGLATSTRPIADASARFLGPTGRAVVVAGALVSILGTLNSIALVSPRLLFAMAEDGNLPRVFAKVHQRTRAPHVSIAVSGILMLAATLFSSFLAAAAISTIIRLLTYAATCGALLRFRRSPTAPRAAFIAPFGVPAAILALALCAWLLANSAAHEARMAALAVALGLVLYGAIRARAT
ncbi:MAG TPA: APC family permease [Gemmatimonadaceae bacterium]|jgi:amino acid transporter